jgi:hypothetical protein
MLLKAARQHRWKITGGYDPELDGDDIRWACAAVECVHCGEKRRVWRMLPTNDPALLYGCTVRGSRRRERARQS